MRLTADTTAYTVGTVIEEDEDYKVVAMGEVHVTRTGKPYQIRQMNHKKLGSSDLYIVGPRGSMYELRATNLAAFGIYKAYSFNTGQSLKRGGNEVSFTVLGDIVEVAFN